MTKAEIEKQIEEHLRLQLKKDLSDEEITLLDKKVTTIRRLLSESNAAE